MGVANSNFKIGDLGLEIRYMERIYNLMGGSSVNDVKGSPCSIVVSMRFSVGGHGLLARGGSAVVDHVEDKLFQFSLLDESLDLPLQMEALGG